MFPAALFWPPRCFPPHFERVQAAWLHRAPGAETKTWHSLWPSARTWFLNGKKTTLSYSGIFRHIQAIHDCVCLQDTMELGVSQLGSSASQGSKKVSNECQALGTCQDHAVCDSVTHHSSTLETSQHRSSLRSHFFQVTSFTQVSQLASKSR